MNRRGFLAQLGMAATLPAIRFGSKEPARPVVIPDPPCSLATVGASLPQLQPKHDRRGASWFAYELVRRLDEELGGKVFRFWPQHSHIGDTMVVQGKHRPFTCLHHRQWPLPYQPVLTLPEAYLEQAVRSFVPILREAQNIGCLEIPYGVFEAQRVEHKNGLCVRVVVADDFNYATNTYSSRDRRLFVGMLHD